MEDNYKEVNEQLKKDISTMNNYIKDLQKQVNFGSITITTCPKCGEKYEINYCREIEQIKSKNKKAIDYINNNMVDGLYQAYFEGKIEDILEILNGKTII